MQSASLKLPYHGMAGLALAEALPVQPMRLELGKTTQGDLYPGQIRDYSVELEPNQYIRAAGADGTVVSITIEPTIGASSKSDQRFGLAVVGELLAGGSPLFVWVPSELADIATLPRGQSSNARYIRCG